MVTLRNNDLVTLVNYRVHERNDDLHERNDNLHERNDDLHDRIDDLHERNDLVKNGNCKNQLIPVAGIFLLVPRERIRAVAGHRKCHNRTRTGPN